MQHVAPTQLHFRAPDSDDINLRKLILSSNLMCKSKLNPKLQVPAGNIFFLFQLVLNIFIGFFLRLVVTAFFPVVKALILIVILKLYIHHITVILYWGNSLFLLQLRETFNCINWKTRRNYLLNMITTFDNESDENIKFK